MKKGAGVRGKKPRPVAGVLYVALFLLLLAACRGAPSLPTVAPPAAEDITPPTPPVTPSLMATSQSAAGETPAPPPSTGTPSPTASPWRVWASPALPAELLEEAQAVMDTYPGRFAWAGGEEADVRLVVEEGRPLATWVYGVAVPFATVDEQTTLAQLQQNWQAGGTPQALVTEDVMALLTELWGAGSGQTVPAEALVEQLWQRRPAWSLVPFQRLRPDLKVLAVDGDSPLAPQFDPSTYPLTVQFGATGDEEALEAFFAAWQGPDSNYEPERMTRVAMTGVTALVRATAYQMEIRDILYPGEEVTPVMQMADVAHVSNEVSFVPDCPPPHYVGDPVFCSDPRYLELLETLGVDVVELTGNHLNDWGAQYVAYTQSLYEEAGMQTFGGGQNVAEAQAPLVVTHNGNRLAFVGCNPVGPPGGWATEGRAGAAPCDYPSFRAQIQTLREEGHVVIATQQYQEIYDYAPTDQQRADFRALAEAGAAAVSGSQGHHAQGFDFHEGAFIHYGLGNLFFDQMDRLGTRQTFVDTYVIYENRLLSVELWTGLIENYARPRLMTPGERRDLLQTVFEASGW